MPHGEFPNVLWTDVDLTRPDECPVSDEHLVEERLVVQTPPVRLVEIPRAVEYGLVAGVELDIDLVAVQRLCGHYVVDDFHRFLSATRQSFRTGNTSYDIRPLQDAS